MKSRSTKRALLSSAIALVVCVAMLVGTTFAWFTDNVSSANNIIKSGNLDVELEYWNGSAYTPVTNTTKLFKDGALWEPGYTEVAYLKVSNNGSLALKYRLTVNVFNEIIGKNKDNNDIILSEHLAFNVVDKQISSSADLYTREQAVAAAGTNKLGTYVSEDRSLVNKGDANYFAVIVSMPASVGDEANHNGTDIPSIEMGVNVVATQLTSENDSFGKDYDAKAMYPGEIGTAAELIDALKNNMSVKLGADIDLSGTTWTPITTMYSAVLDGNGYAIKNLSGTNGLFEKISGATIKNLTLSDVEITSTGDRIGAIAGQTDKDATAPQTRIENVTVSGTVSGGNIYTGGFVGADRSFDTLFVNCTNNAAVTGAQQVGGLVGQANRRTVFDNCTNNGTVTATNVIAGGIVGLAAGDDKGNNTHLTVTIKNCTNNGEIAQTGSPTNILVGGMAGAVGRDGGDPIVSEITAYILDCKVLDGQKLYGAKYNYCSGKDEMITVIDGKSVADGVYEQGTRNYYVSDAKGLVNVFAEVIPTNAEQSQTVNLTSDIDMTGIVWEPVGNMHHTFNGNGHTISNLTCKEGWRSGFYAYAGGVTINDLTLENVTSSGSQAGTFAGSGEGLKMNNCYLKGNNTVSYYQTSETWGGIGAITGVITDSTVNATIAEGATVTIVSNGMETECTYYDDYTGYLSKNNGTVTNNGTVVHN